MLHRDEIERAFEILQPVTVTDENHQAHWWNEWFGERVMAAQKTWLEKAKTAAASYDSRKEIMDALINVKMVWPKYSDDPEENFNWWTNDFGAVIISQWRTIFNTFQQVLIRYDTQPR